MPVDCCRVSVIVKCSEIVGYRKDEFTLLAKQHAVSFDKMPKQPILKGPSAGSNAMNVLAQMIGFVVATDFELAKQFYGTKLEFRQINEDDHGMTFDVGNGCRLRVTRAQSFTPAQGTVLGWSVTDMHATIRALISRGVEFEQFNLAFMPQDELGVWAAPSGDEVAWFKDPQGNILSISKHQNS